MLKTTYRTLTLAGLALALTATPALADVETKPVVTGPTEGQVIDGTELKVAFSTAESYYCSIDDSEWDPCTTGDTYGPYGNGAHVLWVSRTPAAGYDAATMTRVNFNLAVATPAVDKTPPQVTFTGGPAEGAAINYNKPTFTFAANEEGSRFECSIDGKAFATCTSGQLFSFSGQRAHSLRVRATDPAGNTGPAVTRSFRLDWTRPTLAVSAVSLDPLNATRAWSFTANEPVTFLCRLDGAPFAPCASPLRTTTVAGTHSYVVRAVDAAGNYRVVTTRWKTLKPATPAKPAAPTVTLGTIDATVKTLRTKGLAVPLTVNGGTSATATLSISAGSARKLGFGHVVTTLGKASGTVNGSGQLVVKLSKNAKAKLKKARKLSAKLTVVANGPGGKTTTTRSVKLK